MSINSFDNLQCPQLEALLCYDDYTIDLFRLGSHIFLGLHHEGELIARATGESIATALKRANSYLGSKFSMPKLYTESNSKLDSVILNGGATISISAYVTYTRFTCTLSSSDEHVLAIGNGSSLAETLNNLEDMSNIYGL